MTLLSQSSVPPEVLAARARKLRRLVPTVVDEILARIAHEVPRLAALAENPDSVLVESVSTALHRFLDDVDGAPHRDRGIEPLFRAVGRAEAAVDHDLGDVLAAIGIGSSVTWEHIRRVDEAADDGYSIRPLFADAVFAYINHLTQVALAGHAEAVQHGAVPRQRLLVRLAERLLTGAGPDEEDEELWEVPDTIVVLVIDLDEDERPDLSEVARRTLIVRHGRQLVIIADVEHTPLVEKAVRATQRCRLAISWPVGVEHVPDAFRWARRAFTLARHGVIPDEQVIDCDDYRTQIWLHSEPALRQRLCQELLSPLLAETPNSREILSETLLAWLESRDSAPAIASRLGVHPQTVRYRWKRINELFGESLHDPEFTVQITMLLKASVPLWKAGDQSDFERFKAAEAESS